MKRVTLLLLVGGAALGMLASEPPQEESQVLDREAEAVLGSFLSEDCGVGEEGRSLTAVLERKEMLEPHLIAVLRQGPEPEQIETVRLTVEGQWQALERFLKGQPSLGLSLQNTVRLQSIKKEEYVERGVRTFIRKHREGAAVALAAIGSPAAMEALREVAQSDQILLPIITAAIARFQGQQAIPE